jgi:DNA-binding winged helix-turn-helix (wHTH) protein
MRVSPQPVSSIRAGNPRLLNASRPGSSVADVAAACHDPATMGALCFGTFELDETTGELRKAGRRVHLAAQPARVLVFLAQRAGEVVTREALREHVWGADTFVSFDQGLAFCMGRIRLALGDSARSPRFLETLPRRGYRFVAPVTRAAVSASAPIAAAPPPAAPRRARAAAIALCGLVALQGPAVQPLHTRAAATPRARAAFERGQGESAGGSAGQRKSIASFQQAVREDPRFAEAHYALAAVYLDLTERGDLQPVAALPLADREARAALALEEQAASRLVLASARWFGSWDWDAARRDLTRALDTAPDSDGVLLAWARFLSAAGEDDAAIAAIDRAEARSPSCEILAAESARIRYRARRYDDAVRKFRQAAALPPPHGEDAVEWQKGNVMQVFRVHVQSRAWPEAQQDALELLRLLGVPAEERSRLGGQPAQAMAERFLAGCVRFMRDRSSHEFLPRVDLAHVVALSGDPEGAIDLLERAAGDREPALVQSLRDPDFDALQAHPRFASLRARVGVPGTTVRLAEAGTR